VKVRWHKRKDPEFGYTVWYAEVDGVEIATAVMTSHTGTEDYPWDWMFTDEGEKLRIPAIVGKARPYGVLSTLRDVKRTVKEEIGA
jgi:hypothetical protein